MLFRLLLGTVLLLATGAAQKPPALTIDDIVVSESDGGEAATRAFGGGERVFVRFAVSGARPAPAEDEKDPRINLRYRIRLTDVSGIELAKPVSGEVVADLAPEDKKWKPRVMAELELPAGLVRSVATLAIELEDQVAFQRTAARAEIPLAGPVVPDQVALSAANLYFLRQEEDGPPLTVPAYRAGEMVWARFSIVGFERGEQNRYSVAYGFEALNAAGEVLFTQDLAAEQVGESVYPRRYLPSVLSLQLAKDQARGAYAIRLRLIDRLSGKKASSEHRFTVE